MTVRIDTWPGTGVSEYSPSASTSSTTQGRSRWSVVARAGVSKQTVYAYFSSKDELLVAIVAEALQGYTARTVDSAVPLQPRRDTPRQVEVPYAATDGQKDGDGRMLERHLKRLAGDDFAEGAGTETGDEPGKRANQPQFQQ